jgi:hypothetical protein
VGADYQNFEEKNLYKSLNLIKPDAIVLQVRPDIVLDNFKNYDEFSSDSVVKNEDTYMKQITREGFELYPNTKLVKYITKNLKKQGVIISTAPFGKTEAEYKQRISQAKLYEDYTLGTNFTRTHRVSSEIIATTALWLE